MGRRLALLGAVLALTATFVACGGGVSKADFVAKADAACGPGNATISAVTKPSTNAQVAEAAGTATTAIDAQVAGLRALDLPGGDDKRQAEGLIAALAEVGTPTKALQDAAAKNDEAAMAKAAVEAQAEAGAAAAQAQAYGMAQCATALPPALAGLFDGTKATLKAAYLTEAQALCRDASRKVQNLPAAGSTLASGARRIDAYLVHSTTLVADLKALPVPPGDESTVGELLATFELFNGKMAEISAAAKANNPRLVLSVESEFDAAAVALTSKLVAYGLTNCSSGRT